MRLRFLIAISFVLTTGTLIHISAEEFSTSGRDYVPYTENYNVSFNHDGDIDYDLLIAKIMPEIFEKMLRDQGVNIEQQNIVLNRGPQISMYQELSYNCGYVVDYSDNQVYWLEAAINSKEIEYTKISAETPTPDVPPGVEEFNLGWCFGPLKQEVATIFLQGKSYLTENEEAVASSAIKHELRGNHNLNEQEFTIGQFNFDYGEDVLSFCGKFEKEKRGSKYFIGSLKNGILGSFGLEGSMSPLCAIRDDAEIHAIKINTKSNAPIGLQAWSNIRMETVYLTPNSVEKLLERNYLLVEDIRYNMLGYASHIELDYVDFQPENSITVLKFEPNDDDRYMKIRIPKQAGNYYSAYGPSEWSAGLWTGTSILIDGKSTDYTQFEHVRAPDAPYPQYSQDFIFKVPSHSSDVEIKLEIDNYLVDKKDLERGKWADYAP